LAWAAQQPAGPVLDQNARETRDHLRQILQQYPPSLTQVLQIDPSLLSKADYLAPYPTLDAYVKQHPEIAHNAAFFIGTAHSPGFGEESQRVQTMRMIDQMVGGLLFFCGFLAVVSGAVYLIRGVIDHRRWLHATKIQTDAHTKIVDRLSTNEDLMAYLQSPSGQKFLSMAPVIDTARTPSAPVGRILWSMQTGIVVAVAGVGLWIANNGIIEELAQVLHIVATLAIAVGLGFIVSAAASFGLSKQLGLINHDTSHA
jgi:hypothetical protein